MDDSAVIAKNINKSVSDAKQSAEDKFARQGIAQGLLSGMTFGLNSVILGVALSMTPLSTTASIFIAPLVAATINDSMSAIWLLIYNIIKGRGREIFRSIKTFPGIMVCIAAILGGPLAQGGYLLGIENAGPAYAMAISAMCPVVGAILSLIFLKQKITKRVGVGMLICVIGAIVISYVKPEGEAPNFYLGIICALIAAFGWGAEGVLSAFGMSMVDPKIAINIRQATSGIIFAVIVMPIISGFGVLWKTLQNPTIVLIIAGAALAGAVSFLSWYRANSMCGVARGMALNITYVLWGMVFSVIFMGQKLTPNLVIGGLLVTLGAVLVSVNPLEFLSKKNA